MSDWITYYIALLKTCVDWLFSMQFDGVSLGAFFIACLLIGVVCHAVLYKP